jgi:hypothetical protein
MMPSPTRLHVLSQRFFYHMLQLSFAKPALDGVVSSLTKWLTALISLRYTYVHTIPISFAWIRRGV